MSLMGNKSLWGNRDYVRLFVAQVISLLGSGLSSVCLALLAYELADSDASVVLSIAFALKMIAYIVLAPIFAVLSQRWSKKKALIILDLIRAMLFVALPFANQVWHVYVLMFAINACSAAFTPLYQATLPSVLPVREHYTKALSFSRIAYDLEQIVSPVLSAILLTILSFRQLFWIDAMTFVLSAILILVSFIPSVEKEISKTETLKFRSLYNGLSAYLAHPSLRLLWCAYLAVASASAMVIVNTVVYVHDVLLGGDSETALALFTVGLGSMVVALVLPKLVRINKPQRYHLHGLLLISAAFYLGTWLPGWIGFVVLCISLGVGMSCIQTTSGLIINDVCEGEEASQYFAAHFSLTHFWWLLTYLTAGLSASRFGLEGAYWVMLTISTISGFMYLYLLRRGEKSCLSY
ncbi:MFS transporter [Vibrio sp. HENC-03]|uniref:MFS transporter n=1 Tax=Vibrio sp. HENC-03 TaxID=992012 RepID=UPI00028D7E61|nr:MFS transporter [Vibrio sp. HENC-03]EKM27531.1 major Facilitator Superfamily protein [Vibrio sp. HENC-03]